MAFFTASRKAAIEAKITKKEAQLLKLETAYDEASTQIAEYRFDSGEGSQRTEYRGLGEISKEMERLEKEIDALQRKLLGIGVVNMNLRRKQYRGGF